MPGGGGVLRYISDGDVRMRRNNLLDPKKVLQARPWPKNVQIPAFMSTFL